MNDVISVLFSSSPIRGWESVTNWAACDTCHDLIEAGQWSELTDRAVRLLAYPTDPVAPLMLKALFARFRQHRTGAARAPAPEDLRGDDLRG